MATVKRMTNKRLEELRALASQVAEADFEEYVELLVEVKRARDNEEELEKTVLEANTKGYVQGAKDGEETAVRRMNESMSEWLCQRKNRG